MAELVAKADIRIEAEIQQRRISSQVIPEEETC
jgi:hypothetical protein